MDPMLRKTLHNLSALVDLGAEVSSTHNFEDVMNASLHTVLGAIATPRGAIARFSSRPLQMKIVAARGLPRVLGRKITLGRDEADRLASLSSPVVLGAQGNGLSRFVARNGELLARLRAHTAIAMTVRGELTGMLFLSPRLSNETLTADDLAIVQTMSRHIGLAIYNHRLMVSLKRRAEENRRLYRLMRQLHQETVRAFGAAIDLKDAYTKGHSDRVARYCEALAREMGVSGPELENISTAGYLHDIGKIVVERSIINNPRPLTDGEFRELNKHVMTGYEILSNIGYPWKEIAYLTKCHHEKVDGTGYPQGLSGDQIPLGAKIVTVADSYDAMITDRPYRSRLPLEEALVELHRNTGKQFDREVVATFCRLLLQEISGKTRQRVLTAAIGRRYNRKAVTQLLKSMIAELSQ